MTGPLCPEVCTHEGRVGVFMGGAYRLLSPDLARDLAQRIIEAADDIERAE